MKVLIVSCVFPPEPVVSGRTSIHVARALASAGHDVRVITSFPSKPAGRLYPNFKRRLYRNDRTEDGISLLRCFSFLSSESRLFDRFLENFSFGLTSGLAVLFSRRPQVIYSNTWPLFSTGFVFIAAKIRRIPMVVTVQDVYPESLISQGRTFPKGMLIRMLRWWDGVIARGCRSVVMISEKFADSYLTVRRVTKQKLHVIANWGDDENAAAADEKQINEFRQRKKIPDSVRILAFGGNIGVAAGVETLIHAALKLESAIGFRLLIAGAGSRLEGCRELARAQTDGRVVFHSPWPEKETGLILGLADVLLLPTRGRQSLVSVPSKLISYWLAGKPVIALAWPGSDLADMMIESGGGWLVEPDRPDLLAVTMGNVLAEDCSELHRRGEAGREYARRHMTRAVCLPRVLALLEQAGSRTGKGMES